MLVRLDDSGHEFLPPLPCSLHEYGGECPHCDRRPGVIAITPQKTRAPFKIEVPVEASNGPVLPLLTMSAQADLRVHRQQIPLVSLKANTLHAMQGTTADPGMIFHWVFPRRTTQSSKWLAMYVALSRVRTLAQLRSIGLTPKVREIIEMGPPEGIPGAFRELFGDLEVTTKAAAMEALIELGWR